MDLEVPTNALHAYQSRSRGSLITYISGVHVHLVLSVFKRTVYTGQSCTYIPRITLIDKIIRDATPKKDQIIITLHCKKEKTSASSTDIRNFRGHIQAKWSNLLQSRILLRRFLPLFLRDEFSQIPPISTVKPPPFGGSGFRQNYYSTA